MLLYKKLLLMTFGMTLVQEYGELYASTACILFIYRWCDALKKEMKLDDWFCVGGNRRLIPFVLFTDEVVVTFSGHQGSQTLLL